MEKIVERFLRYVRCWTTSDRRIEKTPSTSGQWELARILAEELREIGVTDIVLTESCYVIARIPAAAGGENAPVIGFLAHLDTSDEVSGRDVKPQVVECYDGGRIALAGGLCLDPAVDAELAAQKGNAVIHTDGTTLLGADDKAGVAEIMDALAYLLSHPEKKRGALEIIFSPDEETGKGLPDFPFETIRAEVCYTVDGGGAGEIEAECFNAASAVLTCKGKPVHPGYGRGKMVNAAAMAVSFAAMLPRSESPEAADGYYGYFYLAEISGTSEEARLAVLVRDFDRDAFQRRKLRLERFARAVEAQFPDGEIFLEIKDQYYNMKEKINAEPRAVEKLIQATANRGLVPRLKPIRGGTDGARLTEMGIPTPNIFTGGRNWHGKLEWVSVPEMIAARNVIIELIGLWAEEKKKE
jgi:tripeptide aminopeptidase